MPRPPSLDLLTEVLRLTRGEYSGAGAEDVASREGDARLGLEFGWAL